MLIGRIYSLGFLLAITLVFPSQQVARGDDARPNIVVILCDDMGFSDLGCYGGEIDTPHLDRLVEEGMTVTDAHSDSSVCTPTRYGLLTGRWS